MLVQRLQRFHSQSLSCFTQAGTARGSPPWPQPPRVLKYLPNRQVGQQSHAQQNAHHDLMRQLTGAGVDSARRDQGLLNRFRKNNLFQASQTIENPVGLIDRQRTASLLSHSSSL